MLTPTDLHQIADRAESLARTADWHRRTNRAEVLRHIAADALCAADPEYPCAASLASVESWLLDDDELYLALPAETTSQIGMAA